MIEALAAIGSVGTIGALVAVITLAFKLVASAREQLAARDLAVRRAGAELIDLATDHDWLESIVSHVRRKRVQAVNAQVLRQT